MDGTKIREVAFILWCTAWLKSCMSLSTKTQFTLLSNTMTWNEAAQACADLGKSLAKVDSYLKQKYINDYMVGDWSTDITGNLWIGLHEIDTAQPGITKWSDCTDVIWSNYATGEPSLDLDDKLCYAVSSGEVWLSYTCDTHLQAICESTPGDCTFDTYPGNGCGHNLVSGVELNWDACLANCLTETLPSGEGCWGVGHLDGYSGADCWRFYSADDPDICINEMYSSSSINVGIKICFESGIDSTLPRSAQSFFPSTPCFVIYTTTSQLITTTDSTTTQPTTALTTSPRPTTLSTTSLSTTGEITTSSTTTTSTPVTISTESITTIDNVTTMLAGTSSPNQGVCRCSCFMMNTSQLNLQEEIEKLKALLLVEKTTTSSYKRKFISIKDDRVSSTSIGYMGVTLLVLVFGFIIFLDFPVLALQFKRLFRLNLKHRVSSV